MLYSNSSADPLSAPNAAWDESLVEIPAQPTSGLKVLIADDSPVVAKILSSILGRAGYEVVTAADGIAAAQAVYRERPDVVLLDIFMPRMNGYQVCRLIKQDASVSHIPVLINTASKGRSAEFWSLHTGADGFMLKGASPEELLGAIARVTRGKTNRTDKTTENGPQEEPGAEEILSKVCALVDQELYATTVKGMELQAMLENLTEGILTVDNTGRITNANHFLCGLLGVEASELQNRECSEALGDCFGVTLRGLIEEAIQNNRAATRESEAPSRAGNTTPVEISAVPVHDFLGEIVGAICVFQDITRRREIEALNRLKNDLTDMIVHDLRTPLTSLLMGMETMPMLGELNTNQKEFFRISVQSGHVLLSMINDLLDISKMEDGSLQLALRPVEIADLMEQATRQVNPLAQAKNLTLVCDAAPDLPVLQADVEKLTRTLVNLLSNAIKFTPQNGTITLAARFTARPGRRDSVVFACQDTGEGIPEAAFSRIFEKFGQVESRSAGRMMSTGLGLTFCKMVVEAHTGRIWVQSALGHGSTFSFAIPAT